MKQRLPKGWTEDRIREVIDHYDNQSEEEAIAEAEEAVSDPNYVWLQVPKELWHKVVLLIEDFEGSKSKDPAKSAKKRRRSA